MEKYIYLTLVFVVIAFSAGQANIKSYRGDKVLKIEARTSEIWQEVEEIFNKHVLAQDYDVWHEPTHKMDAHVLVKLRDMSTITQALRNSNIDYTIAINDIQSLIDNQLKSRQNGDRGAAIPLIDIVGKYATYDEIVSWMERTSIFRPLYTNMINIGQTYLNRDTWLFKLGAPGLNKKAIWIDGGVHAREWISPGTVIYILNELIDRYDAEDPEVTEWLNTFDLYILPVANPDGYEYCWSTERLWRKNRRPITDMDCEGVSCHTELCTGVDLNRNWIYMWGGINASPDPCSNLYRGEAPETEPEVLNIVNFIMPMKENFILYKSYHNWGQQFFTRWDYGFDVPPNHNDLLALAQQATDAINLVNPGIEYEAGNAAEIMYPFAGSSSDWAHGTAGIPYSYLTEARDTGQYGFLVPEEQVEPCGRENYAGFEILMRHMYDEVTGGKK